MSAVQRYAHAGSDFAAKLAQTVAVLDQAQDQLDPLVQASSLGAEDMVLTHLLAKHRIAADIFVLDTGKLHDSTLALLPQIEARYGRKVKVYQPDAAAAQAYEARHGSQAMYRSLALRQDEAAQRQG